jgi:hypothetical protein
MTVKGAIVASAVAGLFVAATPAVSHAKAGGKIKCMGANECKGKGGCKSAKNECKGKNGCKGEGWNEMSEKDCKSKNGTVMSDTAPAPTK